MKTLRLENLEKSIKVAQRGLNEKEKRINPQNVINFNFMKIRLHVASLYVFPYIFLRSPFLLFFDTKKTPLTIFNGYGPIAKTARVYNMLNKLP